MIYYVVYGIDVNVFTGSIEIITEPVDDANTGHGFFSDAVVDEHGGTCFVLDCVNCVIRKKPLNGI